MNVHSSKQNRIRMALAALILLVLTSVSGISGCGMGVRSSETSLTIDDTGRIREEIVESQGTDSFTEEELRNYIQQDIDIYNSTSEDAVKLNSCSVQNGSVKISLEYASCADYAAFNQVPCFAGTLQEAEDAGYEVERVWLEPNGVTGDNEIIRERFREWKVFIVSEEINVKVPDKILYASDNVRVTGRMSAVVQSVMNDSDPGESSSSSGGQAVRAQTTIHPLATVADRFGYVIYK